MCMRGCEGRPCDSKRGIVGFLVGLLALLFGVLETLSAHVRAMLSIAAAPRTPIAPTPQENLERILRQEIERVYQLVREVHEEVRDLRKEITSKRIGEEKMVEDDGNDTLLNKEEEEEERVFRQFHDHDFDQDARWKKGLEVLKRKDVFKEMHTEDHELQLKATYFNRCIARFNLSRYQKWRERQAKSRIHAAGLSQDFDTSEDPQKHPYSLSFLEVLRMVQEGVVPPGIRDFDDSPPDPHAEGSSAQMTPRPKPWEQRHSSSGSGVD